MPIPSLIPHSQEEQKQNEGKSYEPLNRKVVGDVQIICYKPYGFGQNICSANPLS